MAHQHAMILSGNQFDTCRDGMACSDSCTMEHIHLCCMAASFAKDSTALQISHKAGGVPLHMSTVKLDLL